jgi:hypothetical protein
MKYILTVVMLLTAFLYIRTAPPTIYLGDSGEVTAAACTLGIGHPPGYPLYMMAAKIFSYLPFGDAAYRLNIFAAFLACSVFLFLVYGMRELNYAIFREEHGFISAAASMTAAAVFVFSNAFWFEGVNAKGGIYMLSHLAIAVSVYSFLKFMNSRDKRFLRLAVYSAGFMAPAHSSAGLFAAAIFLAFIVYALKNKYKSADSAAVVFLFLSGLFTPYLYLFIRAGAGPVVDWSGVASPAQVLDHILRKQYSAPKIISIDLLVFRMGHYIRQFIANYNIAVLFLAAGLYALFTRSRALFYLVAGFITVNVALLIYAIESSAGFLTSAYLPISLYASKGFYLMGDIAPVLLCAPGIYLLIMQAEKRSGISAVFSSCILGFIPVMMILMNFDPNNQSMKFFGYDHTENIAKTLKQGDILLTRFDYPTFNLAYMKFVKNKFSGMTIYDRDMALLDHSIYGAEAMTNPAEQDKTEEKVVFDNPGRVYFTDFYVSRDNKVISDTFGILLKAKKTGMSLGNSEKLAGLYTIRDYYNNKNLDLFYRDSISRYFLMSASYEARKGGAGRAGRYIELAELLASDSDDVLTEISRIYYMELGDLADTIRIMKKKVILNPYDPGALNTLMAAYIKYNGREALDWVSAFYGTMPGGRIKEEVSAQIFLLKNSLENGKGGH